MRKVAGIRSGYQLGTMDGRSTWVGPKNGVRAAAQLSNITLDLQRHRLDHGRARPCSRTWCSTGRASFSRTSPITVVVTFKDLPGNTLGQAGPRNGFENFAGAPFG